MVVSRTPNNSEREEHLMSILHEYWHILTDPAHMMVELTIVLIDLLIIKGAYHLLLAHLHRDIKAGRHKK